MAIFVNAVGAQIAAKRFQPFLYWAVFWAAFILTRPLGAMLGDFARQAGRQWGVCRESYTASVALAAVIIAFVAFLPRRAGKHVR